MKFVFSFGVTILIVCLAGCGPTETADTPSSAENGAVNDDHDHGHDHAEHDDHDHGKTETPQSFEEAVAYIEKTGNKITEAFSNDEPENAHDELHEIGPVIESLPELAKKSDLSAEQTDVVQKATEALLDAFGELDGTLHGGEEVDVADLSKQISVRVAELRSLL